MEKMDDEEFAPFDEIYKGTAKIEGDLFLQLEVFTHVLKSKLDLRARVFRLKGDSSTEIIMQGHFYGLAVQEDSLLVTNLQFQNSSSRVAVRCLADLRRSLN